ncbi:MAG: ABC-type transport auxiliary lipoprotein family protein [Erythrobacter sp.]|nr:ABC-type transport auxiliary lipoprotein family protein [Erythrobacter sp.]
MASRPAKKEHSDLRETHITRPRGPAAAAAFAAAALALMLGGCVSLGADAPDSLLTLTPDVSAPIGMNAASGGEAEAPAIGVLTPEVPAKLDVLRLPVTVDATQIAYLPETYWVEKPARLFRRLIGESLRARVAEREGSAPLILDSDDTPVLASVVVRGTLSELGYDAPTSSVVVRFDAVRSNSEGRAITRRFEARETGVLPETAAIAPALNRAANRVAGEIADWVLAGD